MIVMKCPKLSQCPRVISSLDHELEYINSLPERRLENGEPRADHEDHGVAGQLVTLSVYARKAQEAWVASGGEMAALDNLRKCAAICIRALILYGCPPREGYDLFPNGDTNV